MEAFQKLVRDNLLKELKEFEEESLALASQLTAATKEREEAGVLLFKRQDEVAFLTESIATTDQYIEEFKEKERTVRTEGELQKLTERKDQISRYCEEVDSASLIAQRTVHKTEEEATKLDREARDRDAIMLKMQENITDKEKEAKRLKEQVMAQEREKAEAEEIVKESETVILSLFRDIESYKSQFNSLLKAIENRNSDIDSALKLKKKLEGELIVLTHKLERTRSNVQKVQEER
ncbi:hypothetical protein ADUPG1_009371, partial [Aduncisulcus paluster]